MNSKKIKVGSKCVHHKLMPTSFSSKTGWTYRVDERPVKLMAVSGRWAMVRRPHCIPYVALVQELKQ